MNSVTPVLLVIVFIFVARSSCRRPNIASFVHHRGIYDGGPHRFERPKPFFRHHRGEILCQNLSDCNGEYVTKIPSSTTTTTEDTVYAISSWTDLLSEMDTAKKFTRKIFKKQVDSRHKGKGASKKYVATNRVSASLEDEFFRAEDRPQNDASNAVPEENPKVPTRKSEDYSPQQSNQTPSTGCVDTSGEGNTPGTSIRMCNKDVHLKNSPANLPETLVVPDTNTRKASTVGPNSKKVNQEEAEKHKLYLYSQRVNQIEKYHHNCTNPVPKIIPVNKNHSDSRNVSYVPERIVLHRCRTYCRCCSLECVPDKVENVNFYFAEINNTSAFVILPFQNHTSCKCAKKGGIENVNEIRGNRPSEKPNNTNPGKEKTGVPDEEEEQEPEQEELKNVEKVRQSNKESDCGCKYSFAKTTLKVDGPCSCDCNKKDNNCLNYEQGLIPINREWLRCIKAKKCTTPKCRYGNFSLQSGRCPNREEFRGRL